MLLSRQPRRSLSRCGDCDGHTRASAAVLGEPAFDGPNGGDPMNTKLVAVCSAIYCMKKRKFVFPFFTPPCELYLVDSLLGAGYGRPKAMEQIREIVEYDDVEVSALSFYQIALISKLDS